MVEQIDAHKKIPRLFLSYASKDKNYARRLACPNFQFMALRI